jgi:hypothetical protein
MLNLPCSLKPGSGRTLDEQVALMHVLMTRVLKEYHGSAVGYDDLEEVVEE